MSIGGAGSANSLGTNLAALTGQIRQAKQQLDDWTTCVSAKTTKGQAEIQRLSGEVSADTQRENRITTQQQPQTSAVSPARSIDIWV